MEILYSTVKFTWEIEHANLSQRRQGYGNKGQDEVNKGHQVLNKVTNNRGELQSHRPYTNNSEAGQRKIPSSRGPRDQKIR